MLFITLKEVQDSMPTMHVYAWRFTWHPELGVYRAMVWMETIATGKLRFDKYVPVALAPSKSHVLRLLSESLLQELKSPRRLALHRQV